MGPACASCKHQRKKCTESCVLACFFPVERLREFHAVHKVFGVSNVIKMITRLRDLDDRKRAVESLIWEALCRQRDPVLGPYSEFRRVLDELNSYKAQFLHASTNNNNNNISSVVHQAVTAGDCPILDYKLPAPSNNNNNVYINGNNTNNIISVEGQHSHNHHHNRYRRGYMSCMNGNNNHNKGSSTIDMSSAFNGYLLPTHTNNDDNNNNNNNNVERSTRHHHVFRDHGGVVITGPNQQFYLAG
ncbi:LOB domain-containing protein 2-like [Impatiens glandulifera]|uniref:LOB domain-containing protein 2-like n=1 Tax=Impatiens glandulifera TaxID=253017 RepID=UPI001FB1944B|nr:LOB domain-containing protein 2-like [Impatiens glandulifera]